MNPLRQQRIVIIGGGPAGLTAAIALKSSPRASEFAVTLLDHRLPFEKPCGGGITAKTFRQFPFLDALSPVAVTTNEFHFESGFGLSAAVCSADALTIVSRKDLGAFLLEKALALGIDHRSEKVVGLEKIDDPAHGAGGAAAVVTQTGHYPADFIIGADGAQGISRRLCGAGSFEKNRAAGLGFYVKGIESKTAVIKFIRKKRGYLWVFPRPTHASVGFFAIAGDVSRSECERIVRDYLTEHYPKVSIDPAKAYSATIPLIFDWQPHTYAGTVLGTPYALAGDAAGFADAITGEGIYYAFKSGALLAEALLNNAEAGARLAGYKAQCEQGIIAELQKSANLYPKFYRTMFIEAMVLLALRSLSVRRVMSDLITGAQSYLTLKSRLKSLLPKVLREAILGAS